jgi:hypothetical protein
VSFSCSKKDSSGVLFYVAASNHSTIQQCHRIINKIKESMEGKKVCTSDRKKTQQNVARGSH